MAEPYQASTATPIQSGTIAIGSRTTSPATNTWPALIARRARIMSPPKHSAATRPSNRARGPPTTRGRSSLAAGEAPTPAARASSIAASNPNSIARLANVPFRTPAPRAAPSNRPSNPESNLIVNRGSSLVGIAPPYPHVRHTGADTEHPPHTRRRDPLRPREPSPAPEGVAGVHRLDARAHAVPRAPGAGYGPPPVRTLYPV